MNNLKFEHILAFLMLLVLSTALGYSLYIRDKELIMTFGGVLTSAFTGVIAFFFTKHDPSKTNTTTNKDDKNG